MKRPRSTRLDSPKSVRFSDGELAVLEEISKKNGNAVSSNVVRCVRYAFQAIAKTGKWQFLSDMAPEAGDEFVKTIREILGMDEDSKGGTLGAAKPRPQTEPNEPVTAKLLKAKRAKQ